MSKQSTQIDSRRSVARQHTARLREILRAPVAAQPPVTALPPPQRQAGGTLSNQPPSPPPESVEVEMLPAASPSSNIHHLSIIEQCLRRPRGRVAQLVAKTQRLIQINRILRAFLPPRFHEHATIATLGPKAWVIQTDSSAWATRLRYLLPTLRQHLGEHLGTPIPPLRIHISPRAISYQTESPVRRMTVTDASVASLEQAARNLADERLGAAIQRLAEHARQRNQQS